MAVAVVLFVVFLCSGLDRSLAYLHHFITVFVIIMYVFLTAMLNDERSHMQTEYMVVNGSCFTSKIFRFSDSDSLLKL